MFEKIRSLLDTWKNRLFTLKSGRKIGRFAIFMILLLDLQVFYFVLDGASRAARVIEPPVNPVTVDCDEFYRRLPSKDRNAQLEFLRRFTMNEGSNDPTISLVADELRYLSGPPIPGGTEGENAASICRMARLELKPLQTLPQLKNLFNDIASSELKISKLEEQISELKSSYDTALLEKIAKQERKSSILPARAKDVKSKLEQRQREITTLKVRVEQTRGRISKHPAVAKVLAFAGGTGAPPELEAELKSHASKYQWQSRLYPVKKLAVGILFLLPLLLIAILWNRRAARQNNALQFMASSHLIVISLLPILFKVSYFAYGLLPHTFLRRLFEWLADLNLSFIWNYVVIAATVAGFGLIIWVSQKFFFNEARRRRGRLHHKECIACEERLESFTVPYCYFCGVAQLAACANCHGKVNKNFFHCPQCGTAK